MRFTRWDQISTTSESNQVLLLLAEWHLTQVKNESEDLNTLLLALLEEDFKSLCLHEISVNCHSAHDLYHMAQAIAFFKKRRDLDIGIDRKQAAWDSFVRSEELCRETNQMFRSYSRGGFFFLPRVEAVFYGAQRKISRILGDLPSLRDLRFRFGPGATTQIKKKDASVRRKLAQKFSCNASAVKHLELLSSEHPDWFQSHDGCTPPHLIQSEKVEFVPKSAKTDRKITKAPTLDTYVQLGLGDYMADRLRASGVDLRNQALNQELARIGSISGALATLDLSSASDTIATGLVESLLPFEWWDLLRDFRSREILSPYGKVFLQSFSSMGNGFTFPLETLIFYSLAISCVRKEDHSAVSVYGDDIIVPVYAVPLLLEVLAAAGFIVNKTKSYWDGAFRESCGKDYFSGIDVRPCYVKDALSGQQCFVLHNFYVRTMQPEPSEIVRLFLDESLEIWGPDGFGDGHLISDDFDRVPHNRSLGWSGFTFETYTYKPNQAFYDLGADYVFPQYSIYLKEGSSFEDSLYHLASKRLRGRSDPLDIRPERSDALYRSYRGRVRLQDTLPGVSGYKRVKIYYLG